jgi:predicted DNA-binding transcriptional regulator YafY
MSRRAPTETVAGIIGAFMQRPTWSQADLAKRLELSVPALRKRLEEVAEWLRLDREEDHPHVYWSVPKDFFPGGVLIKRDEVPELLRLLARLPKSRSRDRMIGAIVERLPHAASSAEPIEGPALSPREEQHLPIIEDSAKKHVALRFRYFTASRGAEGLRYASVLRVFPGPPARFVAMCHRGSTLKWFRVDNVTDAALDGNEPFRAAKADVVDAFLAESLDGFHEDGPAQTLAFFVREPEARWVARNLMHGMKAEEARRGIRVTVRTTAIGRVARFVVSLGDAARSESPTLVEAVASIARAALCNERQARLAPTSAGGAPGSPRKELT